LGLALAAGGSPGAWRALVHRPELVRATYLAITRRGEATSPAAVAEWLDRAAPTLR
jgi:hypothetical protein